MKSIRRVFLLLVVAVMLFTTCACSSNVEPGNASAPNTASEPPIAKDTLTVDTDLDPTDMNPHSYTNQHGQMIKRQMYETLLRMDPDGTLVGELCTSWEWIDSLTLDLKIRQGVQFSCGGELKASDVVFSFKLMRESNFANIAVQYMDLDNTKALDDYTVEVKLTTPFPAQVNYFNWPLTAIVSEAGYNKINGDYGVESIGTGPYKLVSYVKDSEVDLVANPDYWEEGKPYIPNLKFRIIKEETTRTLDLESGGVDISVNLASSAVEQVKANPKLQVYEQPSFSMTYVYFNQDKPYLSDYNVRLAICKAIDWSAAVKAAFGDKGKVTPSWLAPGVEGAEPLDMLQYDPEGAKQILKDNGYTDGEISFDMYVNTDQSRVQMAELMQAYLKDVGINMKVVSLEAAAWEAAYLNSEHGAIITAWFAMTGEAGKVLQTYRSTDTFNKMTNWKSPELDALIGSAMAELDTATRIKEYQECQDMLYNNLAGYPFMQSVLVYAAASDVKGFVLDPSYERNLFKNVYFE